MAASKPVEAAVVAAAAPSSGSAVGGGGATAGAGAGGLPRWQLALAVGAPLLLGAGAMYLWSRQRRRREAGGRGDAGGLKRNSERKTPEGRASPAPGSGHPEGPGAHLEMVSGSRGLRRGTSAGDLGGRGCPCGPAGGGLPVRRSRLAARGLGEPEGGRWRPPWARAGRYLVFCLFFFLSDTAFISGVWGTGDICTCEGFV